MEEKNSARNPVLSRKVLAKIVDPIAEGRVLAEVRVERVVHFQPPRVMVIEIQWGEPQV
jgi:hypothetical protein